MSDLISRQDAIDAIHEDIDWLVAQGGRDLDLTECMERAKSILNNLPSAEPEKGKWIFHERREPQFDISGIKTWGVAYICSECEFIHTVIEDFGHYLFCPNCGADMRGEQE